MSDDGGGSLIVTALLDDDAQQRFDRLRRSHFPPERNHLAAHLTLFHSLPGEQRAAVELALRELVPSAPVAVEVTGVRLLGRGVAYTLRSAELSALRADLATRFRPWLSAQDKAKRADLHITVQNKVAPRTARDLHARLSAAWHPETVTATGLGLWRYLGGPWRQLTVQPFA